MWDGVLQPKTILIYYIHLTEIMVKLYYLLTAWDNVRQTIKETTTSWEDISVTKLFVDPF